MNTASRDENALPYNDSGTLHTVRGLKVALEKLVDIILGCLAVDSASEVPAGCDVKKELDEVLALDIVEDQCALLVASLPGPDAATLSSGTDSEDDFAALMKVTFGHAVNLMKWGILRTEEYKRIMKLAASARLPTELAGALPTARVPSVAAPPTSVVEHPGAPQTAASSANQTQEEMASEASALPKGG